MKNNNEIKDTKIKAFVLRLKTDLFDELKETAKDRGHSVNTLMLIALTDYIKKQSSKH